MTNDPIYRVFANLGMNRNVSEFLSQPGEWKMIRNADILKFGVLRKRDGYSVKLNNPDTDKEILSLIPFELGTIRKMIMITKAGNLYAVDPIVDSTWGSALQTGLDTSARWGYTVMSDSSGNKYMVLGNGVNVFKTADAITFSTISNVPLGKYWAQLFQRVYCAGVPADPDLLHWCSIGDLTNWSTVSPNDSSSQNIDRFSRGTIKGIRESNDRIVIYKDKVVKRWDGDYLKNVMASNGLGAPYSLAEIEGMLFSLDRDAIRIYDGNSPFPISEKIQDIIDGISFSTANAERICGDVFKKRYYLSVGDVTDEDGDTISNCWIVFDYIKNLIWLYSLGHQMTAMSKLVCSDGVERLFVGDVSGNFYQMFDGTLDGTLPIQMSLKGHIIYPAGPEAIIKPKKFTMVSKFADEAKVMMSCDGGEPFNVGDLTDTVTQNLTDDAGNNVRGFELSIQHATEGNPEFKAWSLEYEFISSNRV